MTRRKDTPPDPAAEVAIAAEMPPTESVEEATTPPAMPDSSPPDPTRTAPPPTPDQPARRSGLLAPVFGGALAAIGGFGLSHFNVLGLSAPDQGAETAALAQRLDTALAAIEARQAELQTTLQQDIGAMSAKVSALEAAPAPDLSGLADLDQRLQAIEAVPPGSDASTAALAAQLAEMQRRLDSLPNETADSAKIDAALARLATVEAEAQARAEAAAAAVEDANRAKAQDALATAAGTGAPFGAELAAMADPALQAKLAPFAAGVAPLADLQAAFPDAARAALQVARATDAEAGWDTRLIDFLGAQTGARSVEPRDGDSPDAILSRAEFALREGRLADALAELDALPPEVQSPLAAWREQAEARLAVDSALAEAP